MNYAILTRWVIGFAVAASLASIDCGDDDTTTPGTGGSSGRAGSAGRGGTATGGGGSVSTGGAGTGGTGTGGTGTGGTGTGGAGTGGTSGAGSGGTPDSGRDAPADAPRADADAARPDGDAATAVSFASVIAILDSRCTGCHRPRDSGTQLLDLMTLDGLYGRLTTPLPASQEGTCGFDGGDGGSNRIAIVPGDTDNSFLYLKIVGRQPAGCGERMPRVPITGEDGGPAGTTGCDKADGGNANCLSLEQINTIGNWIAQGARNDQDR